MLKLNLDHLNKKIDFKSYEEIVNKIHQSIENKNGKGNDFLGWLKYPLEYDKKEVETIKKSAQYVRDNFEVLVVCGIGGSYLGSRAVIEALNGLRNHSLPEIIFLGQTLSSDYLAETLNYLKDKKFAINVISKSGTTTETAISFRLLKELLETQVGEKEARKAIFATTDATSGALKEMSSKLGYQTFTLPKDIGGRYSVFTPVGLFPLACAGIDIDELLKGAEEALKDTSKANIKDNLSYQYAVARYEQYKNGKASEMLITYEPRLVQLCEWWKQLFGESEGKEHKGLLPISATFTTDLHSLGQFIQEGSPVLFETIIYIKHPRCEITIPSDEEDLDGLNYLSGKTLSFVNDKAFMGTLKAHTETGGVSNIVIEIEKLNERSLGYLLYFFMKSCAMSAYLLDVNPFNQPGVEVYKKNMFHLLGKKGY